jgi:pimeloyl-ACP methyl ester carboxylesterase
MPRSGDTTDHLDALRRYLKRDKIDLLVHASTSTVATTYAARYPDRVRRLMTASDETSIDRISKYFLSDE